MFLVPIKTGDSINILVVFKLGPDFVTSKDTGGAIPGLTVLIFPLLLGLCYFLPFLTDYGAMESRYINCNSLIYLGC